MECEEEPGSRAPQASEKDGKPVPVTDEIIMAFADGELEPKLVECVREAIDADDRLRRKFENFRNVRILLTRAFDGILEEPVPERLLRAVAGDAGCAAGPGPVPD
jgi:anti-sigma factor RsiW